MPRLRLSHCNLTSFIATLQRVPRSFSFFFRHAAKRPSPAFTSAQCFPSSASHSFATYVKAAMACSNCAEASYKAYSHRPESLSSYAYRQERTRPSPGVTPLQNESSSFWQPSFTDASKSSCARDVPGVPGSKQRSATISRHFTACLITYSSSGENLNSLPLLNQREFRRHLDVHHALHLHFQLKEARHLLGRQYLAELVNV